MTARPRWLARKAGRWLTVLCVLISAGLSAGVVPDAGAAGAGEYSAPAWWPLRGTHLLGCTNGNGCTVPAEGYHGYWALDINASREDAIYAAGAGQVDLAVGNQGGNCDFVRYGSIPTCPDGSRGNLVRIKHDAGGAVTSFYEHFTNVFVKTGDWVDESTVLGVAGDSGLAYPGYVHLHFEVRHGAFGVDPVPLQACQGDQLKSFPGEFGKTSWSDVAAYRYEVRSDGTTCDTGTATTLPVSSTTSTTVATSTTTTTVAAGPAPPFTGNAVGVSVPNLTIFGGVPPGVPFGPTPGATLAGDGLNSPQSARVPGVAAKFGPATVFSAGAIAVSTGRSLSAGPSVTSAADVQNVNASRTEVFTAAQLRSTCSASSAGLSGATMISGGQLQLSEGDPDIGGDETYVALPAAPAPNTGFDGRIETVGDSFRYVFNEHVFRADGSLTVYAAHLYMIGPTAIGDVYIGGVTCGVQGIPATTSTSTTSTTSSTPATTTTTTAVLHVPACAELSAFLARNPFLRMLAGLVEALRSALGCGP